MRRFPVRLPSAAVLLAATVLGAAGAAAQPCARYELGDPPLARVEVPIIAWHVAVDGNTAWVGGGGHEVTAVDVSDPLAPVISGHAPQLLGECLDVEAGRAYAGAFDELVIADVADPQAVVVRSRTGLGRPLIALDAAGDRLYALAGAEQEDAWFLVVDVADPAQPLLLGELLLGSGAGPSGLKAVGDIVYVTHPALGFGAVDVGAPATPLVHWTALPGVEPRCVDARGARACVGGAGAAPGSGVLVCLDIADPAAAIVVGSLGLPAPAEDVQLARDTAAVAYAACGAAGLAVVSLETPALPALIAAVPTADWTGAMALAGDQGAGFLCEAGGLECFRTLATQCAGGAGDVPAAGPAGLTRLAVAPNPFNPATRVTFELDRALELTLTVHDARGALVRRLASGVFAAGPHAVTWDGRDQAGRPVAAGMFRVRASGEGGVAARAACLVK